MNEERLMILTMLQEGKISSEEAARLIEALDEADMKEGGMEDYSKKTSFADDQTLGGNSHNLNQNTYKNPDWEDKLESTIDEIEKKAEKFGEGMEDWGNNFGEKMSKIGADLAEGATSFADKLLDKLDNFVDKDVFVSFFGNYETIVENLEKNIASITKPNIQFEGINGKIIVNSREQDHISVKATCQVKKNTYEKNGEIYEIVESRDKLIFKPKYTNNMGVKLEVNIPSKEYKSITLLTTNGKIEANDIKSDNIYCNTTNSSILLSDLVTEGVAASTTNGRISISDCLSRFLEFKTTNSSVILEDVKCYTVKGSSKNGKISLEDISAKDINIATTNGPIVINDCSATIINGRTSNSKITVSDIEINSLNTIELRTSNGAIDLSLGESTKAVHIDAETSMGHINLNIPNIIYDVNDQAHLGRKKVIAHSPNFQGKNEAINIITSTSNGLIKIN